MYKSVDFAAGGFFFFFFFRSSAPAKTIFRDDDPRDEASLRPRGKEGNRGASACAVDWKTGVLEYVRPGFI